MLEKNKLKLIKGIRFLAFSMILTILGPVLIYSAFSNSEHAFYEVVLVFGILIMFGAIGMIGAGIKFIIKSIFN